MKTQQQNAMIYCRVDLYENTDGIYSINQQEKEVLKFCKNEGYEVVKKFTDYTGSSNKKQPELENMKNFAKQSENRVDVVVCLGFDRIARTFERVLDEMIDFNQMGIDVISVQQITNYKNNTNEQNK